MRNWFFLASHILSAGITLLVAFISFWVPWKASQANLLIKDVVKSSALDFASPLPWLGMLIVAWFYSIYRSKEFSERLHDYEKLRDNYDLMDKDLYDETEAHQETKESYYKSLKSSLKYILCQAETGFSENCRVSVYRIDENDHEVSRNIFRFASQHQYNSPGRDEIPIDQGIVGLSYATSSLREFKTEKPFGDAEYKSELDSALSENGIKMPPNDTRMPSRHVLAKPISDITSGDQVGVVVYESTTSQCLKKDKIEDLLRQEDQNVSRFVKHLAVLDAEFNPRSTHK